MICAAFAEEEEKEERPSGVDAGDVCGALKKAMPNVSDCVFHWTTVEGLTFKRLFESVAEITLEGRLLVSSTGVVFVNQCGIGNQKGSVSCSVSFALDANKLKKNGSFYFDNAQYNSLFIPFNVDSWSQAVRPIRADCVVGICATKESVASECPTLDLYIMKKGPKEYYYKSKCPWLYKEYMAFGEAFSCEPGPESCSITLPSLHLKQFLSFSSRISLRVKLEFGHDWAEFIPIKKGDGTNLLYRRNCDTTQPRLQYHQKGMVVRTKEYCTKTWFQMTKATSLSKDVVVTYASQDQYLQVMYDVGKWGTIVYHMEPCRTK